jgi:polysaccharide pyruvyl transferase WcaK-like protein
VGAEAMESRLSQFFIRRGLALANYRSFRDEESKRQVEKLGVQGTNHVFPDLAFSLGTAENYRRKVGGRFRGLVAIGAMAYLDPRSWPKKDSAGYSAYVQKLVGFAAWLIDREYAVCLFPSEIYMDHAVIQDVMKLLKDTNLCGRSEQVFENRVSTVGDLLHQLAAADFVVASRLHGVILSHVVRTPVLAVSYDPKVDRVMRNLGLSEYCMSIDRFDLASLTERFCSLESNQQAIRKLVAEKTAEYRTALKVQYESIFKVQNEELSSIIIPSEEGSATSPVPTKVG